MRTRGLVSTCLRTTLVLAASLGVAGCTDALPVTEPSEGEHDVAHVPALPMVDAAVAPSSGAGTSERDAAPSLAPTDAAALPGEPADGSTTPESSDSGTLQPRACPLATAPIAGKILKPELLQASPGPHDVTIMLVTSADHTALNQARCSTTVRECPERTAAFDKLEEEHRELQRCLRAWITEVGATASEEVFALVNVVFGKATWEQAQRIAAHPDVRDISPEESYPPP